MTQPAVNPTTTDPGATPPAGGNPTTPPAGGATPPAADPPKADAGDGLGEAGKKALEAERAARKDLEKQLAALAPLKDLAAALGVKADQGKTDVQTLTEQVAALQKQAADDRLARMRAEVAAEKKLPPALAGRLQGTTVEELAADADALLAAFPAAANGAPAGGGTPRPDLTQGARGGANELLTKLAEAQKAGNAREAIRLKTLIAEQQKQAGTR